MREALGRAHDAAIIGTGFIGRAWAITFARAGHDVALWDQDPDAPAKAIAYIDRSLPDLAANDLLDGAAARSRSRVSARRRRLQPRSPMPIMFRRTRPRMSR